MKLTQINPLPFTTLIQFGCLCGCPTYLKPFRN